MSAKVPEHMAAACMSVLISAGVPGAALGWGPAGDWGGQYFGHLMRRVDSLEKTLCWEGLGAGGEGDDRG